jgi:Tol biopolymer transport system component/tRNA A-37 threonylcarbamoyl transferase component Bud32
MVGKVLAQYQISEKLGEGGMGVVWKARDTRLDRFVALKTLSAEKLADPERKRRFVQEAKAASALNHPNIVHIYDIADADGVQFIAMEYVAGKTLDQSIGRKGLRLNEALKYAVQIADALAKAHSAGIIHRDLKPSNIMVTENGLVKVLDFGLAKLAETATGESGETATVREPEGPNTEEGTIVGTIAYMSPEQAEGKKVDARSDIFSFGSVLYEMVTGRRAFHGDSKLSTLSAILKDDPKPVTSIMPDVPRDLEKIISHCLRKDPERRFQHMADVKTLLDELKEESDSGKLTGITAGATGRRPRLIWVLVGATILLLAAAGVGLWLLRPASHAVPKLVPLTSYPGQQRDPAFSPDGKQVAFAWNGEKEDNFDIYVKLVDAGTPLRLTSNPADEYEPAWSPDGRYIAFSRAFSDHTEIWMIPALGGAERKLGELAPQYPGAGLSWSPDGKYLALVDKIAPREPASIFLLSVETGDKRKLTSSPTEYAGDFGPLFSPDGKTLAFVRYSSAGSGEIYVLPVTPDGRPLGEPRRLTHDERLILGLDWTADGRRIVYSSGQLGSMNLLTIPASGGAPERLAVADQNPTALSISRSGSRLVYERDIVDLNIWRIPGPNSSDNKSAPSRFIASTQWDLEPQFSPDGTKIVFSSARSGSFEIWVCDREGKNAVQLTSSNGPEVGSPRWSPDSRWIAFDSLKAGNSDIYVISTDGRPARRLTTGPHNNTRPSWSTDGRWIYFGSNRSGDWQIWKQLAQGGAAVPVTKTEGGEEAFESLDGKSVYYAKLDAPGIWKVPAAGGEETRVLDRGGVAVWALTGQGICFFDLNGSTGIALKFYNFATGKVTLLRQFSKDTSVDTGATSLSVSPDGGWILYTQLDQSGSNLMLVENYR